MYSFLVMAEYNILVQVSLPLISLYCVMSYKQWNDKKADSFQPDKRYNYQ